MSRTRRRTRTGVAALLALLAAPAGPAASAPHGSQAPVVGAGPEAAVLGDGTLSFDGHATLGDFVGTTSSVSGAVTAGPDLATARGWVEAPVATLRTGNGRRDRDLRQVMEVDRHPTMRYELAGVTPRGGDAVTLHGTLTLHGVSRRVDVPATVARVADTVRVAGTFPVNVTDYQVRGLSRALGVLRMREHIEVHLALRFVVGG